MFSIQQQIHFSFTSKFTYIRIYILYLEFGVHIFVVCGQLPGLRLSISFITSTVLLIIISKTLQKKEEKQKELMPKTMVFPCKLLQYVVKSGVRANQKKEIRSIIYTVLYVQSDSSYQDALRKTPLSRVPICWQYHLAMCSKMHVLPKYQYTIYIILIHPGRPSRQ